MLPALESQKPPAPASAQLPEASPRHLSLEIVVVGTGDRTERLQPQVLQALRQRGIAVEVQDTVRSAPRERGAGPRPRPRQADAGFLFAAQCLCHFQLPVS